MLMPFHKIFINKKFSSSLLFFLFLSVALLADTNPNTLIISGQLLNYEYGNPVIDHEVCIKDINDDSDRYFKTLTTDIEGYYYDTIITYNNKGSFIITTNDHNGNIIDTTVHFRFLNYSAFDVIIANFRIVMPYNNQKLQARFKYLQKQGSNRYQFKFSDLTKHDNIILWEWDFGDGNKSNKQSPNHTYQQYGVYKVSFTVTTKINTKIESSTITRRIFISDRSYYHMGGQAFIGYFPIDYGLAYLYFIDSSKQYIPVDTLEIDTLGFYLFYQIPEGNYVVKVQPDKTSEYYESVLPTYYGDELFWANAQTIHFKNTCWEYDIQMKSGLETLISGDGLVNGTILFANSNMATEDASLNKIDVFLIDEKGDILTSHYSDKQGFFDFSNINTGTYSLYPELTGIETKSQLIVLNNDNPDAIDLELIIGITNPDFIFERNIETGFISNVFPNPASSVLNIELELELGNNVIIEVYDLQGRLVLSETTGIVNNGISVDVNQFKSGTYIINLSSGNQSDRKLFVVKN